MFRKTALILSTILFAFLVLSVSILKSASINYAFSGEAKKPSPAPAVLGEKAKIEINYYFPYPGKILPDNSLWFLKAGRDRVWLGLTSNKSKKAELMLLFADKRLLFAKALFEKDKPELAYSTLTKAEKYLEGASKLLDENTKKGIDTVPFAIKLAQASLKHKEVIDEIYEMAPEDAKPKIREVARYSENTYKLARDILRSKGVEPPESPFDWD